MITGKWQQHEIWDGTYTFNDWADIIEIIEVENENNYRCSEAVRAKASKGGMR